MIEDTGEMMRRTQNSKNRMEYTYLTIEGYSVIVNTFLMIAAQNLMNSRLIEH